MPSPDTLTVDLRPAPETRDAAAMRREGFAFPRWHREMRRRRLACGPSRARRRGEHIVADTTTSNRAPAAASAPGGRRAYAILTGIATLFVFIQFFTSGEFIRSHGPGAETWTEIHGYTAYGVLAPALIAAIIALVALRRSARVLTLVSIVFFVAAVGQWGTGHLISTFHLDGWTPFHVFFSSVVLAFGIWASVRSALLQRA